jgi:hypothetical protein
MAAKIADYQVQRKCNSIILGIGIQNAVMDVATNMDCLKICLKLLTDAHMGSVDAEMGRFGEFTVALGIDAKDETSIFIDGPQIEGIRGLSAAIWVEKSDLRRIIELIINSPSDIKGASRA